MPLIECTPAALWVAPELLIYPLDDSAGERFLVHSAVSGALAKLSRGAVELLAYVDQHGEIPPDCDTGQSIERLIEVGLLRAKPWKVPSPQPARIPFWNSHVTLLPTHDCSLRCIYCYSEAGHHCTDMPLEVMKAALDFGLQSALEHGLDSVDVDLRGGGEPLLARNIPNLREMAAYGRRITSEAGLKFRLTSLSNGIWSPAVLQFAAEEIDSLQFSVDGADTVQNRQRPAIYGQPSFDSLNRAIQAWRATGKPFSIRATVSRFSSPLLPEIVRFFARQFGAQHVALEPLFECGRCANAPADEAAQAPDPQQFVRDFAAAVDAGEECGVRVGFSGFHAERGFAHTFCGAAGSNFLVTPEGDVTTCDEVSRRDQPAAQYFFIGRYDPTRACFVFDEQRIAYLASRTSESLKHCQTCFLKHRCAGFCAAKSFLRTGSIFGDSGEDLCEARRKLALLDLRRRLATTPCTA